MMRRRFRAGAAIGACLLASAGLGQPARQELHPKARKVYNVLGRVVDQAQRPLAGVRLTPGWNGEIYEGNTAVTDDFGTFALSAGPGEVEISYQLGCEPPECAHHWLPLGEAVHHMTVEPDRTYAHLDLVLPVGAILSGRVLDARGEPVPFAALGVDSMQEGYRTGARADAEGRFRTDHIPLVPAGRQAVRVTHHEHGELHTWIDVRPGLNELELRLPAPLRACGRVVDEHGGPVSGAEVVLIEGAQMFCPSSGATSGPDGRFELPVPKPGMFYLRGRKEGYDSRSSPGFLITGHEDPCQELMLWRGVTIAGRVVWADGVEPEPLRAAVLGAEAAEVDPDSGTFVLRNALPGGHLTLSAAEGTRRVIVPIEVPPGVHEVEVEARIERGHDLAVALRRGGQAVAGHQVALEGPQGERWKVPTDETGTVTFVGLPAGDYLLDPEGTLERTVSVPRQTSLVLDLPADASPSPRTPVLVEVVDDRGEPIADADVLLDRKTATPFRYWSADRTDVPGQFRILAEPGRRVLRVRAQGRLPVIREVEVPPEGEHRLRVALERGSAYTFRVVGPAGAVPVQVSVGFRAESEAESEVLSLGASRLTGPNGEVTLYELPQGGLELEVRAPHYVVERRRVVVPGPPVVFELTPLAAMVVDVPELAAEPADWEVRVFDAEGRFHPLSRSTPEWKLPRGASRIEDTLPPGRWTVEVIAADGRRWTQTRDLIAGRQNWIRLTSGGC